jgi:hypothetical protein
LQTCQDITRQDITTAVRSRDACRSFLDQVSAVADPGEGAARVLKLFARLAENEGDWLDGDLRVELCADGEATVVDVQTTLVEGLAERVFARHVLRVPLEEIVGIAETLPRVIWPLALERTERGVRLVVVPARRSASADRVDFPDSGVMLKAPPVPSDLVSLVPPAPTSSYPDYEPIANTEGVCAAVRRTLPYRM